MPGVIQTSTFNTNDLRKQSTVYCTYVLPGGATYQVETLQQHGCINTLAEARPCVPYPLLHCNPGYVPFVSLIICSDVKPCRLLKEDASIYRAYYTTSILYAGLAQLYTYTDFFTSQLWTFNPSTHRT